MLTDTYTLIMGSGSSHVVCQSWSIFALYAFSLIDEVLHPKQGGPLYHRYPHLVTVGWGGTTLTCLIPNIKTPSRCGLIADPAPISSYKLAHIE